MLRLSRARRERPPAPTAATGGSGLLLGPGTDLLRESAVIPLRAMALAAALTVSPAGAQEFRLEEVPSVTAVDPASLKTGTIAFSDQRADHQRCRQRHHEAPHRKAPHVRRRSALPDREAAPSGGSVALHAVGISR